MFMNVINEAKEIERKRGREGEGRERERPAKGDRVLLIAHADHQRTEQGRDRDHDG